MFEEYAQLIINYITKIYHKLSLPKLINVVALLISYNLYQNC